MQFRIKFSSRHEIILPERRTRIIQRRMEIRDLRTWTSQKTSHRLYQVPNLCFRRLLAGTIVRYWTTFQRGK